MGGNGPADEGLRTTAINKTDASLAIIRIPARNPFEKIDYKDDICKHRSLVPSWKQS